MPKNYLTNNSSQTKKLGEKLAEKILEGSFKKQAFILGLEGDLGGGKTTFLQGFAKGLGIKEKILSPTFIIIKKFKIAKVKSQKSKVKSRWFYHIDCYRIKKPREISNLGFKEIVKNPENIVAIEWAEKIRKTIPRETVWVKFEFIDKTTRRIMLK